MELIQYWNESFKQMDKELIYDYWLDKYGEHLNNCNKPIVDLGCGIGNNTLYLLERNYRVISCDFSEVALNKLKALMPHAITKQFDMREGIPFNDCSVRIVIADLSLHYFDELTTFKILESLNRVLDEKGILLCRLNSTKNLNESSGYYINSGGLLRRYFDEEQLDYFFRNEQWEILSKSEYIMNRYSTNKVVWELSIKKSNKNR